MENYQEKYENAFKILKAFYDKARFSSAVWVSDVKMHLKKHFLKLKVMMILE